MALLLVKNDGIVAFDGAGKFNEDKTDIPNALTAIDVTGAPDLVNLYLNANKISSIDLSKNTQLVKLNIANNNIAAIELSAQVALTTFTANDNQLSALDLSKNVALTTVTLSNNKLTTLDFTNNPLIKTFTVLIFVFVTTTSAMLPTSSFPERLTSYGQMVTPCHSPSCML